MQQFCTYGSVRGASGQPASLPRKSLMPIALSRVEGCARSSRFNVLTRTPQLIVLRASCL